MQLFLLFLFLIFFLVWLHLILMLASRKRSCQILEVSRRNSILFTLRLKFLAFRWPDFLSSNLSVENFPRIAKIIILTLLLKFCRLKWTQSRLSFKRLSMERLRHLLEALEKRPLHEKLLWDTLLCWTAPMQRQKKVPRCANLAKLFSSNILYALFW